MHAAKSKASDTFKEADKENAPQVAWNNEESVE